MTATWDMALRALLGIPRIRPGDDLAAIITTALADDGHRLRDGDVLVVAQKIISKAEGRVVQLNTVTPGERARALADRVGRDPRLVQLYLDESAAVLDILGRHVITLDVRGIVDTGGGVDLSNTAPIAGNRPEAACLLPADPDASAVRLRDGIRALTGIAPAVIISDSLGSYYREGSAGAAIGLAGIAAIERPGGRDLYGNPEWGDINRVDELAAAASSLMGQAGKGRPVVLIRGAAYTPAEATSIRDLLVKVTPPDADADQRPANPA